MERKEKREEKGGRGREGKDLRLRRRPQIIRGTVIGPRQLRLVKRMRLILDHRKARIRSSFVSCPSFFGFETKPGM